MKSTRRPLIPQRRRIFLGCEGESERGYGAYLRNVLEDIRQDVHLDVVLLNPGAGDPLALVERARDHILHSEQERYAPPYEVRALLLDSDRRGTSPNRDGLALQIAANISLRFIWQEPCHEALLLRHLEGHDRLRPATSRDAIFRLTQIWTTYEKGLSALRLAQHLTHAGVLRAAAVEPDLQAFLLDIGFI